tara:strand:- start:594 stop:998 length:405 start_codon:yes stop_codon:yes gene_type:complete
VFQRYKKNFFSQNGEDGIILEILKRLKLKQKNKWCCEFGAWDGIHGSNTFNLIKKRDYNAVYIEGDFKKYQDLLRTKKEYKKIVSFNKYVSYKRSSHNTLDKISPSFIQALFKGVKNFELSNPKIKNGIDNIIK